MLLYLYKPHRYTHNIYILWLYMYIHSIYINIIIYILIIYVIIYIYIISKMSKDCMFVCLHDVLGQKCQSCSHLPRVFRDPSAIQWVNRTNQGREGLLTTWRLTEELSLLNRIPQVAIISLDCRRTRSSRTMTTTSSWDKQPQLEPVWLIVIQG